MFCCNILPPQSGFVVMDPRRGRRNPDEQEKVEKALRTCAVISPLPEDCEQALSGFASSHPSHGVGLLDALIGQAAVFLDLPLQTFNQQDYGTVP